jgi:hypothetical protein
VDAPKDDGCKEEPGYCLEDCFHGLFEYDFTTGRIVARL